MGLSGPIIVTRGYVWIIPASSCKIFFNSKKLLYIMVGADNVSIRLVLFFWGGSFGLRVFESIAILRSEFARCMAQPGCTSEPLGSVFALRRGLEHGLPRRLFFASTCATGAGGRSSSHFMAPSSGSCSCCVGRCNCRKGFSCFLRGRASPVPAPS